MKFPTPLPRHDQRKVLATLGYIASCGLSVLLLGPAGFSAAAIFAPLLALQLVQPSAPPGAPALPEQHETHPFVVGWLSRFLGQIGYPTVAMVVEIDDFDRLEEVHGVGALDSAIVFVQNAIDSHLTEEDITVHMDGARIVAALAPQAPHDLETMLNTCTRIQHSMADAQLMTDLPTMISVSIGFASSNKIENATGETLLQAAFTALSEARRKGPNAVRSYSRIMANKRLADQKIVKDAQRAFEKGEIFAYFQPQIRLSDGILSGFEALTRWNHPDRGIVSPAEFLPALEQAGLMQKLGDTMIKQAVQALTFWDKSGLDVPRVGVNFSTNELRNPRLVERIAMHLETGNIAPDRLVIEVLETVVAGDADDDIIGNLAALADLGCGVDLDDFGTGYASISNITRFSVGRIKIDRSFVAGVDTDDEQRSMVAAIHTMAGRLGVSTLAEGIETKGELETLRDLGCHDAQGFQFARPMPIQETVEWAHSYFDQSDDPIRLSQRAG